MLTRRSAEAIDRELARRNPVFEEDLGDPAHAPRATALLRHIFELADAGTPAAGPPAAERSVRRVPRAVGSLAALAVVVAGTSGALLYLTRPAAPHRTITAWLASRPLAADARSMAKVPPATATATAASWRLVSHLVPSGWRLGTPGPGPGTVTCPTTTVCYVTGDTAPSASGRSVLGGLYVSTDGARSWSVLALPRGFTFTSELSCASAVVCAAGGMEGGAAVFAETRDGGHRWTLTTTGKAGGLVHVACVSASRCMALSLPPALAQAMAGGTQVPAVLDEHFARTTDGGATWTVTTLPARITFSALQCPSATDCVAIGYPAATGGSLPRGIALWTQDGGRRWQHGSLPAGIGFSTVSALSCGGPARCMAVATSAVPNPSPCSTALQPAPSGTVTAPTAFSCSSASTTWISTMLTTADGGATWTPAPLPSSLPQPHLVDVACAGPTTCWAAGTRAVARGNTLGSSVLVGTTDGGARWTVATVTAPTGAPNDQGRDASMAVGSISCPSAGVCVALGVVDQGATFAPVYRMDAAP